MSFPLIAAFPLTHTGAAALLRAASQPSAVKPSQATSSLEAVPFAAASPAGSFMPCVLARSCHSRLIGIGTHQSALHHGPLCPGAATTSGTRMPPAFGAAFVGRSTTKPIEHAI